MKIQGTTPFRGKLCKNVTAFIHTGGINSFRGQRGFAALKTGGTNICVMHHLNNFRAVAILLVILGHAVMMLETRGNFLVEAYALIGNGTILFVVISGLLFSNMNKTLSYPEFLKNKFLSVILPYLVISIPAIAMYLSGFKSTHRWLDMHWFQNELNPIGQASYLLATGAHLGPLWFMPMIILFYLASPVFHALRSSRWLLPVTFGAILIAFFAERPEFDHRPFHAFVYYTPAFLFGMWLAQNKQIYEKLGDYLTPALAIYAVIWLAITLTTDLSSQIALVTKLIEGVLLLAVLKRYADHRIPVLAMFSKLSFFMYFIHGYIISALRNVIGSLESALPPTVTVLVIFLIVIVSLIPAYLAIALTVGKRSKYLVGA